MYDLQHWSPCAKAVARWIFRPSVHVASDVEMICDFDIVVLDIFSPQNPRHFGFEVHTYIKPEAPCRTQTSGIYHCFTAFSTSRRMRAIFLPHPPPNWPKSTTILFRQWWVSFQTWNGTDLLSFYPEYPAPKTHEGLTSWKPFIIDLKPRELFACICNLHIGFAN